MDLVWRVMTTAELERNLSLLMRLRGRLLDRRRPYIESLWWRWHARPGGPIDTMNRDLDLLDDIISRTRLTIDRGDSSAV